MLNPKDALIQVVVNSILANKDQYIEKAKEALIAFVKEIKVPGQEAPVLDKAIADISAIATAISDLHTLIVALAAKYGHPAVAAPDAPAQPEVKQ